MIQDYGWSSALQNTFAPFAAEGLEPARVVIQQRGPYRLVTQAGEADGHLTGRFEHAALPGDYPVTGDWVACALRPGEEQADIHAVLPRASVFTRRAAGPGGGMQTIAANVDVAMLATSLNGDLNLRRLERYLATAYESGADPVMLLTKSDACDDVATAVAEVEAIAFGIPVLAVSARTGEGLEAVRDHLKPGRTAVLVGSSGVGKSTLVNALAGEDLMATQGIREDDARGRHTTTHRELIRLPSGALILDTPGMRELGLWEADAGLSATFADVEALEEQCRFSDCAHGKEPGCAVRAALEDGRLGSDRWEGFQKLQRELAHEQRKVDPLARQAARKLWIGRHKDARAWTKAKRGDFD